MCERQFSVAASLSRHMSVHVGDKLLSRYSGKYRCTDCGKYFQDSETLAVHSQIHSKEKPFKCNVCSKRFTNAGNLVNHSKIHSGEKPYRCHVCDLEFSESERLKLHMRKHTQEKLYKCYICQNQFSASRSLKRHMVRVHKLDKPYRHTDGPCTTECDSGDWSAQVQEENLPVVKQEPDDTQVCCAYLL